MIRRRTQVSEQAMAEYQADTELAGQFGALLGQAQEAEQALRTAQADRAGLAGQRDLAKRLDEALTSVMRAAFAAERVAIGPRGYDDRIYRRKARAKSPVRAWSLEAQRLLTLRETHRLTGIARLPQVPAA